jgi:3-hydroxybutyrate dehydrogenase
LGIAHALAQAGSNIVLNGFGNAETINEVKNLCEKQKVKVHYHPADLSKPAQVKDLINDAFKVFGGVDILVNNAGVQHVSPVENFPDETWDSIISINLSSAFHSCKAVIPYMKSQKWGRIINTASAHGLVASKHKSAYVASKHGLVGLTKTIALELAGSGVTANCINPGWVLTPLVEAQIKAKAQQQSITIEKATEYLLEEKQPSKQFATVDQMGGVVLFLCSPSAAQITGISLPIDGGWTAQ